MKENYFAISLPQTGKNVNRYASFNLSKFVIVGPGEIAIKLTEALLKNPDVIGNALSGDENTVERFCKGVPTISTKIASLLWEQMTRLGWVLEQDLPEPEVEQLETIEDAQNMHNQEDHTDGK
jgi:hypothetical protein